MDVVGLYVVDVVDGWRCWLHDRWFIRDLRSCDHRKVCTLERIIVRAGEGKVAEAFSLISQPWQKQGFGAALLLDAGTLIKRA